MGNVAGLLSKIFGAVSIVALIRQGFQFGFAAPLKTALDYIQGIISFLFGWSEPYLIAAIHWANSLIGFHLVLAPSWKYWVIPTILAHRGYVIAEIEDNGQAGTPGANAQAIIQPVITGTILSVLLGFLPSDESLREVLIAFPIFLVCWMIWYAIRGNRTALKGAFYAAQILGLAVLFVAANAGLKMAGL